MVCWWLQLHTDPCAVDKIFKRDVGFFWQTVDSQEGVYQHGWRDVGDENPPQNTLFLLSKQALFRPQVGCMLSKTQNALLTLHGETVNTSQNLSLIHI